MKKITFLFLLSITFSFGQVLVNENFEAGLTLPTGWTNNDIDGGGNIWTFETGGEAPGFAPPNTYLYDPGTCAGNYAIFNSDAYGGGPENAALESPVFDCTGLTVVKLSFSHFYLTGYVGEAYVEVYNGSSWVQVAAYTEASISPDTFVYGAIVIDVSSELAGVNNAQVRFRWTGDYSWFWAIDNIVVQQPTEPVPDMVTTPNPTDGATNVDLAQDTDYNGDTVIDAADAAYTFTWADGTGSGGTPTGYTFYLGTTSPPAQAFNASASGFTIYGLDYSETYYWQVVAYNVTGDAVNSTIWSFTTEADPALSVDDESLNLFSVYPNPIKDNVKINTSLTIDSVEIHNQLGQRVMDIKGNTMMDNTIDVSSLNTGVYFLSISAEGKSQSIKIIKE